MNGRQFLLLCIAMLPGLSGFSQGCIFFQNTTSRGREPSVYGVNPENPYEVAAGFSSSYAGRKPLSGPGYSAELLLSLDEGLHYTRVYSTVFRTAAPTAQGGLIHGNSKVCVEGLPAGTVVSLAVRAWDNRGGVVDEWDKLTDDVPRGMSLWVGRYVLSGVKPDGTPTLGSGNLGAAGLQAFGLHIVPEPVAGLFPLACAAVLLLGRSGRVAS